MTILPFDTQQIAFFALSTKDEILKEISDRHEEAIGLKKKKDITLSDWSRIDTIYDEIDGLQTILKAIQAKNRL